MNTRRRGTGGAADVPARNNSSLYLREAGIHHFIYVISPQSHGRDSAERFTFWWPGDEYVDILGYDYYEGETPDALRANLRTLSEVAAAKQKPCAVTEAGLEAFRNPNYWTQQILEPATAEGGHLSFALLLRLPRSPFGRGLPPFPRLAANHLQQRPPRHV